MKTEQILQLVEAVSGFGLDEFEYEEDGVKLKLKKGGNVCTSVSAETAGRTKTEAEIARTEENAEVLLMFLNIFPSEQIANSFNPKSIPNEIFVNSSFFSLTSIPTDRYQYLLS